MTQPKKVEFYRYMIPINESVDDGSVTYARLTMMEKRPRARHVVMKKYLKYAFEGMTRAGALLAIREMGFEDLNLCRSLQQPN